MKLFTPPERLTHLDLVLQYDSELQEFGYAPRLTINHRFCINQERAAIIRGSADCQQFAALEQIITKTLIDIAQDNWAPKKIIEYD